MSVLTTESDTVSVRERFRQKKKHRLTARKSDKIKTGPTL